MLRGLLAGGEFDFDSLDVGLLGSGDCGTNLVGECVSLLAGCISSFGLVMQVECLLCGSFG